MQSVPHPWRLAGSPTMQSEPGSDVPYFAMEASLLLDAGGARPVHAENEVKNADERANLDVRFLADLWLIVHLGMDGHPPLVMFSEVAFVTAGTALALRLLPVPASFVAAQKSDGSVDVVTVCIVVTMASALMHLLYHVASRAAARVPAISHVRRRSLPLLFLSVQMYNVAGFFISIVPSLIYQALTASPRQCDSLPALLLRAVGYICAVTVCKALVSVAQSGAALLWRQVESSSAS